MGSFLLPRVIGVLLAIGVSLPVAVASSQDAQSGTQEPSVADAARRNRDKKKNPPNPPKSPKVITDDDLDKRNFRPGQDGLNVGSAPQLETAPPSPQAVAAAEAADAESEQQAAKDAAEEDTQIARVKEQLANAEKDLDLDQRQLALDQDTFFSNPNYQDDAAGKGKLQNEKQQIADQQQEVEKLKAKLATLEERKSHRKPARKQATPPAQTETPPSTPPPQP